GPRGGGAREDMRGDKGTAEGGVVPARGRRGEGRTGGPRPGGGQSRRGLRGSRAPRSRPRRSERPDDVTRWSARLPNAGPKLGGGSEEFRVLFVPGVFAGAERTEFPHERTERSGKFLGISVHAHEHIVAGEPAARDDLSHRTPPS